MSWSDYENVWKGVSTRVSKIFLKIKKYHWHVFWHEKLIEKHPQPHCQTHFKSF